MLFRDTNTKNLLYFNKLKGGSLEKMQDIPINIISRNNATVKVIVKIELSLVKWLFLNSENKKKQNKYRYNVLIPTADYTN